MDTKAKYGVWTPNAKVLCFDCHGPEFPLKTYDVSSDRWSELTSEQYIAEGNDVTTCDKCGCDVQLNESVAREHHLGKKLREHGIKAEMWQTGGMCSALGINKKGNWTQEQVEEGAIGHYMITYNFDGDGMYWLTECDEEGCAVDVGYGGKTEDEMIEYILGIKENMEEIQDEQA